ncbi:unnamed protein product [Periconia digitata]|uniref:Heterokaryon incompatibility domain-containing protein n=1 Tax=Periconia digitata TaxID=1303443 RepID=A0A9W4XP66_9PLEO|nr:unnamed protein product [Periconia digitata]
MSFLLRGTALSLINYPCSISIALLFLDIDSCHDSMPQNFQDAVTVTRMLGIQYLWIDSLCIIQDSKEDWEREGAKMGDIYHNAYVTIAATCASKSEDGFLQTDFVDSRTLITFPTESFSMSYCNLVLQETDVVGSHWEEGVEDATWNSRAWTMQERFLSPRTIHFSKHQIYWECQTQKLSETGESIFHAPLTPPDRPSLFVEEEPLPNGEESVEISSIAAYKNDMYDWWYTIAARYSIRNLTYPSDKLPALSGLAALMSSLTATKTPDSYLCGIWEGDLAFGLLWRYSDARFQGPFTSRAPSWSWAKSDNQVIWRDREGAARSQIRMISKNVQLQGLNPYGEIKAAVLHLSGKIIPVALQVPASAQFRMSDPKIPSQFPCEIRRLHETDIVAIGSLDNPEDRDGQRLHLLQVERQDIGVTGRENNWSGLLMQKVDVGYSNYLRIGVYILCRDHLGIFETEEERPFTLE